MYLHAADEKQWNLLAFAEMYNQIYANTAGWVFHKLWRFHFSFIVILDSSFDHKERREIKSSSGNDNPWGQLENKESDSSSLVLQPVDLDPWCGHQDEIENSWFDRN